MKKILFISCLILSRILVFTQIELPINSDNKIQLSNWLVAKLSNIDEKQIEAAITSRTKAIVPVHYAGYSCEIEKILEIFKN